MAGSRLEGVDELRLSAGIASHQAHFLKLAKYLNLHCKLFKVKLTLFDELNLVVPMSYPWYRSAQARLPEKLAEMLRNRVSHCLCVCIRGGT